MHLTHPIPGYPQFSVLTHPGYREYRVEHFFVAQDGSGRVVRRATGFSPYWGLLPALLIMGQVILPSLYNGRSSQSSLNSLDLRSTMVKSMCYHHTCFTLSKAQTGSGRSV